MLPRVSLVGRTQEGMLARCTEQVLSSTSGDDALVEACLRMTMNSSSRRRRNDKEEDLSVRGAIDALQGILRRAEEDPSAYPGNGAAAAVWVKVLTVAKRAERKRNEERLRRTALFARWLLAREDKESRTLDPLRNALTAGVISVDAGEEEDEEDSRKWVRLSAAELVRRACSVPAMWNASEFEDVAPGAMAALGASQVAMALVEACGGLNPSSSSPSRAAVSASRAIHEVTHALARADAWVSVTSTEEDEVDSDDEKEIRESRAKSALGARCRRALWRLRSPLAAAYRVEIQWYSEASSHRGPFVAAIADLKDEIGGDALSLATGEYDAPGAAAAAARQRSTVARGCEGVAETLHVADLAERDGDDERAAKARKAASAALTSSSVRFAWLVRTAPPSEIAREWEGNKDASAVAALEEMARYMAGVADKNSVEERDEEEDSDDDGEAREYFRKKAEKRATMADVRRVTVRRFCLLLGQIKRKRLDSVFTQRRELLQSLHNSSSTLLRAKAKKVPGAGENHSNETVFLANEVAATASMAAIATRRLLENVLGSRQDSEQAAQLAAPLLSLLDSGERDSASSVVCELVAPLALLDGSVLSDVLGRIAHDRSESSLDAIRSILLHAAVDERSASPDQVESRRRVRKRIAEDLVAWLVVGPKDPKAALMAEGIGNLFGKLDADVVVPLVCSRLCDLEGTARPAGDDEGSDDAGTKPGSFNPSNACRIALENALGTCIAENRDSATAVDLLACALRETRPGASKPQSTTPLDSPGSIANATASPESTPAGDDGVILASWVERVLDRVPNWIVKIAALGGDRWVRTAESTARSASTHSKDAISLRIWGGVCDSLSEEYATFRSFRRITKIMHSQGDLVSLEQAGDENLLFERLAPLLALKRVPAQLWTEYTTSGDDELSTEEETEGDLTLTPTERVADLCHKRAFSSFEHKTISTVAAEVLGRLPPKIGAKDAHPALSAFLKKREQTSLADTARVATYALCHASSVHGLDAVRGTGALDAILRTLALEDASSTNVTKVQQGCVHSADIFTSHVAGTLNACRERGEPDVYQISHSVYLQALAIAKLVGDGHTSKTAEQPLITVLDDSELGEESQPGVVFLPFLMQVASLCPRSVPNSLKPRLRAALDKILEEESEAAKLTSLILWTLSGDHHATLQFGCLHALVIAAQQITVEFGALELLANTVGPGALHNAATVVCSRDSVDVQKDDFAKGCSSSWMQLVFVLLIRLKKVPHRIRMRDVFGVALEGVRHCPSSGDPIDVAVRQSALKLLASLVGVAPRCFATLPMASFAQTTNALQSLAAMDPSRELRQLASTLSGALAETVEYTVRQ